jgi:3-methylfumaryl-CoA hydratase
MTTANDSITPEQLAHWRSWLDRSETRHDLLSATALNGLAVTLDRDDPQAQPGTEAPPLAHWMCFAALARQSVLGPDGHPQRGGFLPAIDLPRRMWAGGRLQFHHALRAGDELTRRSRIATIDAKSGRSGPLAFVTVQHEIHSPRGLAISEEHDIVYREAPQPGAAPPTPQRADTGEAFSRSIVPDPVLLFRYSALTFNGHRIHYDRPYATEVEGYGGLIVHGPLIATLLMDLLRRHRPDATVRRFEFMAVRPLFDTHAFTLCGRPDSADARRLRLWTRDHEGMLTMRASAELA